MGDIVYLSGLTYAAVEILKQAGVPSRYAGLAAIVVGVLIGIIDGYQRGGGMAEASGWVMAGAIAGLTAAGAFSGAKAAARLPERDARGRFTARAAAPRE